MLCTYTRCSLSGASNVYVGKDRGLTSSDAMLGTRLAALLFLEEALSGHVFWMGLACPVMLSASGCFAVLGDKSRGSCVNKWFTGLM